MMVARGSGGQGAGGGERAGGERVGAERAGGEGVGAERAGGERAGGGRDGESRAGRRFAGGRGRRAGSRRAKELGQNFLRDPNILDVIVRESELSERDVVLEVGGGEGVLSTRLAAVAEWVHVVELDERLRETLERRVAGRGNVTLWWGDAMQIDLTGMRPRPTKMVANLPYGVAAAVVLRTIEELPGLGMWLVMVQREVGERLAAAPGSRLYGASSVLAQLAGEVRVLRRVSPTVFRPAPNVESALVRIVRTGPGASPQVRELIRGAFAHRRKALARSLVLAGEERVAGCTREEIREALRMLGHPADARAERLAPEEFVALARELGL